MADEQSTALGPFHTPAQSFSPLTPVAVAAGMPCAPAATAAGSIRLARANTLPTSLVQGLAVRAAAPNTHVLIQYGGSLELTTDQWDAIAGTTGGLTKNAFYYLSAATDGHITSTAPTGGGTLQAPVGIAISRTALLIRFSPAPVNVG